MPSTKDVTDNRATRLLIPTERLPSPDLRIQVQTDGIGQRLDLFLAQHYPEYSRNQYKKMIVDNSVLVNCAPAKPRYCVAEGDCIEVWLPQSSDQNQLVPEPMSLSVLYEDGEILIINKPSGLVVHPGAGNREGTLVHGLLAHCPRLALQGAPLRPGIVHRLDKGTSGALVVAKTERAYLHLINQFKSHQVDKEYLALVYGAFRQSAGTIKTHLGRNPRDRKKMAVVESGREAISRWVVHKAHGEVTLLRVNIETGRTHQIRVHLSHINRPVIGDTLYGGGKRRARAVRNKQLRELLLSSAPRQMLHAWKLTLTHPQTKEILSVTAPLPDDFGNLLAAIETLRPLA